MLAEVGPYLRVKSQQARFMVQFQKHVQNTHRTRDSFGRLLPLSVGEKEIRERFYNLLKFLNKRGPQTLPDGGQADAQSPGGQGSKPLSSEYLAGFIDGEGSLMLARVLRRSLPKYGYVPRVSIDNTNRAILETIRRSYGGTIYENRRQEAGWKTVYKLLWTGPRGEPVLRSVAPYLRLKSNHARTLLSFIHHVRITDRARVERYAAVSDTTTAYREALYWRVRRLNARGPPRVRRSKVA